MMDVTLYVDIGEVETIPVSMPGDTDGLEALKRCMAAVGLEGESIENFRLTVSDDIYASIPYDSVARNYDGMIVRITYPLPINEASVRRLLTW